VTRTFVQTGNRVGGRAEILKGLKEGDRVVAVGQLKLQSGSAVTISTTQSADPASRRAMTDGRAAGGAQMTRRATVFEMRRARNAELSGINLVALTDIFIKRPVLSVVVSLLILLIGFRAATSLPIRQYPKLSNTVVNITTVYPGASANLIQGFITTPLEQAVASAEGVDYITSSSVQGTSTIQVYIKLNFDPNQALTEVLAKVNSVRYLIPKESNDPIVTKTTGQTTAVMYLGFSSEELSGSAISDYLTRVVQPVLSTVDDGVRRHSRGQTFAMRLWLDPCDGAAASPSDVRRRSLPTTSRPRPVRPRAISCFEHSGQHDLRNLDQFKKMIVKSKDGGFVRIEDIATVELAAQARCGVAFSGERAIFIGVQATPQAIR
jgi:multidrug efflux pump